MTIIVTVAPTGAAAVVYESGNSSQTSNDGLRADEHYRHTRHLLTDGQRGSFTVPHGGGFRIEEVDKGVMRLDQLDDATCLASAGSYSAQVAEDIADAGFAVEDLKPVRVERDASTE